MAIYPRFERACTCFFEVLSSEPSKEGTSIVLLRKFRVVFVFKSFSRICNLLASISLSVSSVRAPGIRNWRSEGLLCSFRFRPRRLLALLPPSVGTICDVICVSSWLIRELEILPSKKLCVVAYSTLFFAAMGGGCTPGPCDILPEGTPNGSLAVDRNSLKPVDPTPDDCRAYCSSPACCAASCRSIMRSSKWRLG